MSTQDIVAAASDPLFYDRVGFIALKVAQNVASEAPETPNHTNRVAQSSRVLNGSENNMLLARHVASANPTIAQTLDDSGPDAVPDGDIEFALATIWDARANAFAQHPV